MKVLFCWDTFEGFFIACWRKLAERSGIHVTIIGKQRDPQSLAPYSEALLDGLDAELLEPEALRDVGVLVRVMERHRPDVVVFPGWGWPAYNRLAMHRVLKGVPVMMVMDTPLLGTWRQRLGRFRHPRYFRRLARVVPAGERSFQLAKVLGFPEEKIRRGMLSIDEELFSIAYERRREISAQAGWPKRFLYVGRYVEVKGIDVLLSAYEAYRRQVEDPWPLSCCGRGPLGDRVRAIQGVEDHGFVQPTQLPEFFAKAGTLLLPSRYEPWGCVLAEGAASGLPLISSEACGASVDVVRDGWNGRLVATGNPERLAEALVWTHRNHSRLDQIGDRSREMARPYSAAAWAERWELILSEL